MKGTIKYYLSLGIIVLAGCAAPEPTPTAIPEPTATTIPVLAQSADEIFGIWQSGSGNIKLYFQFNPDGTFRVAQRELSNLQEGPTMVGEYSVEAGLVTLDTNAESALCTGQVGIYEVYLLDGDRISLILKEDPCLIRATTAWEGMQLLEQ